MHKFLKSMTLREIFIEQVPALGLSILIAELFYKFHSFTLECLAFLVTWYLMDLVIGTLSKLIGGHRARLDQTSK
jgi:hypothetical protein